MEKINKFSPTVTSIPIRIWSQKKKHSPPISFPTQQQPVGFLAFSFQAKLNQTIPVGFLVSVAPGADQIEMFAFFVFNP